MARYARSVVVLSVVFAAATAVAVVAARPAQTNLTVHEWGTFTSVADPDGQSADWTPLAGPEDLPCFVDRQRPEIRSDQIANIQVKGRDIYGLLATLQTGPASVAAAVAGARQATLLVPPAVIPAKIRMETPVLYFYSPTDVTVSVKVAFEQGMMSEWYPKATTPRVDLSRPLAMTVGTIEWPSVHVLPGANVAYPQDASRSHYYAAREVDASPLQVDTQNEKFLFYRGLADFQPSLAATIDKNGDVTLAGTSATPRLVLFENRAGRVGYQVLSGTDTPITVSRPALTGNVDALRADLVAMLTSEGLYPREARAMVETWRDSWFEEGVRVFYVIPKAAIDQRLPLTISPVPANVARVFVGRLELITPEMKNDVERALAANDLDTLNLYGRFLDSIVLQIADRPSISANPTRVQNALRAVATSRPKPAACQ